MLIRNVRWLPAVLAFPCDLVYLRSFFLPTYGVDGPFDVPGWDAFMVPIHFLLRGERVIEAFTCWLPNPLFWLAAVLMAAGFPRTAFAAAALASLFAALWLWVLRGFTDDFKTPGANSWLASMLLMTVAALTASYLRRIPSSTANCDRRL